MKRPAHDSLARVAGRLARGSELVWQRRSEALAAWVRAGRRDDLTGWRAMLGPAFRLAILGGAVWLVARLVRARPVLMWAFAVGWLVAAWRASRPAPDEEGEDASEDEPEQGPAAADPNAVRRLLADLIGDRPGVRLSAVLAHLQARGLGEGWEVAELRARLEAQGVPVRRSVKVAGRVAYGVHRDDLPAPSPSEAADRAA
ncbi:hypothetical protein HUF15_00590 [Streptomyces samsunensis]|uniref:hypothetical protein n=1 Tax=Streptomyces malaysiensis TaxID=92644 RepID=UPI001582AD63|nr:hypothetical protein [Streptomyces samsunensis]NUH35278.1 hypothetical protein [Streptomyces samsunensis]